MPTRLGEIRIHPFLGVGTEGKLRLAALRRIAWDAGYRYSGRASISG